MNTTRWLLGMVAVIALAACGDNHAGIKPDAAPDASDAQEIARQRGEYIVNVTAACGFCHTPLLPNGTRDMDRLFAGVDCFADLDSPTFTDDGGATGCISTRNLTPHASGLGSKTPTEIKNAFRNGVRTDGKKLVPIMPWYIFHNMTDDDADAVVTYLKSLTPVDHTVKANQPPFSNYNDGDTSVLSIFPFMAPWFDLKPLLDNEITYPIGGENNAAAMHGRYLMSSVGLCVDCHTSEIFPFALQLNTAKMFAGGKVFPKGQLGLIDASYPPAIATRNLTSDTTGLGGWTKMQIKAAIAEGRDRDNKAVCAATHGGVISPYAALTPEDLDDIAEFLVNLPAIENDTANDPTAANCGPPPIGVAPETVCDGMDTDLDGVPDDGCPYPCGNCQGPTVP